MALEVWVPEGVSESFTLTIDEKGKTLYAWPYKWYSVTVINDDEDNLVKVTINSASVANPRTIEATESRAFQYKKPTISQIFLITETGKTASVRVETER